ncbi:WASH complex subunit 3 isoform X5 [Balaenoptera ricei]|uniref:WASH complex subunit 3 isoform X5 n=1 Tax=Balaenoptera ricei TaxID=2746895 RepID=UPI0028BEA279|nr:WASH complex subunit 3 isoform X5 [Balaenoptera ricei]
MDEDGLPLMGSGIDLTKVPAIQQKRTVAFLNQFVVHTVQFLNRFSTVCEEKLADLSLRIQQIETTLNILDAKLSSIPGLDDVTFEVSPVSVTRITNETHSETTSEQSQPNSLQDSGPQETEVTPENILTVAKDPRYARYLKMVQVGVPVMAIRNKMISEGLDPDLLDKEQTSGASLVTQWLRILLPMQGTRVRALVREDPTCCGATKPMHHNY